MSNTGKTDIRHCEACGQVKFPSDHWQQKLAAAIEQRDKATNDALKLAAQVCDEYARDWVVPSQSPFSPLADKIRALKECGE